MDHPFGEVVLALAVMLIAAKLGGDLVSRLGQPAVLGELLAGVLLGNLSLLGFARLEAIKSDGFVDLIARLGVLILLFQVGLESTVAQMLRVGWTALLVATLGVVTPFLLGFGVAAWWLPDQSSLVHAFIGATLTATSVGITARVLRDLDRGQSLEAQIILGAAVIDDVFGLMILAVVSGVIGASESGGGFSIGSVALIVAKAGAFLVGALLIGRLSPRLFRIASRLHARGVLIAAGLSFCFLLSWLATAIGLAPIVGAFAAGLVLEDLHTRDFVDRGEHRLEELLEPIAGFLVPIFFVLMGMRTDLRVFGEPRVLAIAGWLILAAVIGKQACALGAIGIGKDVDRISIGLGMIPRGEVGLIFANIGLGLQVGGRPVIDPTLFSAIVVMVIVTTVITPPALKWSLSRAPQRGGRAA